jgi:hypothetical protein
VPCPHLLQKLIITIVLIKYACNKLQFGMSF